jgi:hypothetical protein
LHSTDSDAANPGIKATLNLTDQYKKEILNTTDLRAVEERASLLTNKESNVELNNSNFSKSGSEYNSSSGGSESRKNCSVPGVGLSGGLTCLYGGWRLRKK